MSYDSDLQFTGLQSLSVVGYNLGVNQSFTVAFWFQFVSGTFGSPFVLADAASKWAFSVNQSGIQLLWQQSSTSLSYNNALNDGLAHGLALSVDVQSGNVTVYLDGSLVYTGVQSLSSDALVPVLGSSGFNGAVSRLTAYSGSQSAAVLQILSQNCTLLDAFSAVWQTGSMLFGWPAVVALANANSDVAIVLAQPSAVCQGSLTLSPVPPTITCPSDVYVYQSLRIAAMSWPSPTYKVFSALQSLSANYFPGQNVPHGQYEVIYSVTDSNNLSASCSFVYNFAREYTYILLFDLLIRCENPTNSSFLS